jgi:hypothetical protein
MIDTQQKTKQYKNVAVAIIRNEEGQILLVKASNSGEGPRSNGDWEFPSNVIVPGATYTETFVADVLETTGCIVEAVSLVSSEKHHSVCIHLEYVECKVVCRDVKFSRRNNGDYKWVHPGRVRSALKRRLNRDITSFLEAQPVVITK